MFAFGFAPARPAFVGLLYCLLATLHRQLSGFFFLSLAYFRTLQRSGCDRSGEKEVPSRHVVAERKAWSFGIHSVMQHKQRKRPCEIAIHFGRSYRTMLGIQFLEWGDAFIGPLGRPYSC